MRKKDIVIGQEYAAGRQDWSIDRVRVEAFDQPRTVYSQHSFRGHTVHDGVLVTLLDRKTGEVKTKKVKVDEPTEQQRNAAAVIGLTLESKEVEEPITKVVITRDIQRTWDEQITHDAEVQAKKAKAEQTEADLRKRRETVTAKLSLILDKVIYDNTVVDWDRKVQPWAYKLNLSDVETLVGMIRESQGLEA